MVIAREEVDGAERIAEARERGVRFVQLQFTDILGVVKAVTIPIHQLEGSVRHGTWFDGSSIEGFTRIAESDQYLMPGHGDVRRDPVADRPAGRAGRPGSSATSSRRRGEPFAGDPRNVLRRQVERARKLGYVVNTGPELEFFLFRRGPDGRHRPRCPTTRPATSTSRPTSPRRSARTWSTPSRRSGSGSRRPTTRSRPASTRSTSSTPTR